MTQTLLTRPQPKEAVPKEEIQADLADLTSLLAELEDEFGELQVRISVVQDAIKVRREYLSSLESKTFAQSTLEVTSGLATDDTQQRDKRSPTEMLRDEYKGMKLGDIAVKVLRATPSPLTTIELTRIIYDTKSGNEFDRARNSLSTELRVGAKGDNPKWQKVGRYAYSRLYTSQEEIMQ